MITDITQAPFAGDPQRYPIEMKRDIDLIYSQLSLAFPGIQVEKLKRIHPEIRLSQAQTHAERYGKLGIGLHVISL